MTGRFVGWLWLLSGLLPILALLMAPPAVRFWCFALFAVLETAHSFSPIVLAWTHKDFRRKVILPKRGKYIGLPAAVFVLAFTVGVAVQVRLVPYMPISKFDPTNAFSLLVWGYSAWNLYHFGMQDFGVWRLWRMRNGRRQSAELDNSDRTIINCFGRSISYDRTIRWLQIAICLGLVIFFVEIMRHIIHSLWVMLLITGLVSVNHWVVDIGLSSRVAKRGWVFIVGVLSAGLVGFLWIIPTPNGMMIRMIPLLVCARIGLGFVHFLYSRWVWQLSNPLVRATIGHSLLRG